MPHNTSISEFERQKQDRIAVIKNLIRTSESWNSLDSYGNPTLDRTNSEKDISKLVKSILVEIDKV